MSGHNVMEHLAVARARLNETLGRPVRDPVEPAGALALPDPLPEVPEATELLERAGATRPELLRFSLTRQVPQVHLRQTTTACSETFYNIQAQVRTS